MIIRLNTILALILIFLISNSSHAQHSTCNGTRYITGEFINADTTTAILFGNNTTFSGINQDLYMDIYEPAGDVATTRPVIIIAFGGQFIGGTRQDVSELCNYYAKRGFVAASIDYRLFDGPLFPLPSNSDITDVIIKASSDMKAAVRFLKEDAATSNTYKIDSNFIFIGGIGSGAIVANHVAYLDSTDSVSPTVSSALLANGGWTGNSSTNLQFSSKIHGVLNFSGALIDTSYISTNEPPLFSAHDDADATIPYAAGQMQLFSFPIIYVQGSALMHQKTTIMGIYNTLITVPSSTDHVSYFNGGSAAWEDSVKTTSCNFLNEIICPPATNTFSTINETACDSYTSLSGNYVWTISNTYMDTIPNLAGADSIITVNLTINSVSDITTNTVGLSITANNSSASYQWLDCNNNYTIISSETSQSFTATTNGNYAIELSENGCTDTSACIVISSVGIIENNFGNELLVYPNPTDGNFSIDLGKNLNSTTITITDLSGKIIQSKKYNDSQILNLKIKEPVGVYLLIIESENKKAVIRLIKE
jgi:para-nitrobenzyl esterase